MPALPACLSALPLPALPALPAYPPCPTCSALPRLLCRLPGLHKSSWIYCDGAYDAAVLAYNATTALRPLT